ncbi:tRNA (adenosine(37)-N6)-threonylcarbamoyltransferase complex dimerization subunit type 1 TsaB [Roseomonas genomospecies 6]|uniref:tRNA (Adenosine(37)-N6)-threonylcarbamoyltransferase complex dimerization subunit type 1 TsaB n=1 Tax=Roseomonas genomospecies 6 TaxID=214106 RepID=A0A9W7NME6_9PROT|nr:tRNA (adenosine(37)-N6)-threonylcarbamoyltransferase complex dimerization subunit type 1 TsaB [Roseomonas genomospecies 6]KAA0682912.1 tRNA (adenosine(37)-N6)-threonylcarbamoyltransferase complex dimerization subunit type 1 TsaB [Roseomonas genomospecies 6]
MRVLGLDTATSGCSAALWDDGTVTVRRREPMARGQAEALVPLAQAALAEAGCAFGALDRVAVTVGPGAFTGLRIALAAARGFALAAGLPVVGVTSFDAILHGLPVAEREGRAVLVAVDSRRTEPFLQLFHPDLTPLGEPAMLEPAAVPGWLDGLLPASGDGAVPLLVAGDGATPLRTLLEDRPDTRFAAGPGTPDAAVVAALGAAREAGLPAQPFYLRPPDVSLPRKTA